MEPYVRVRCWVGAGWDFVMLRIAGTSFPREKEAALASGLSQQLVKRVLPMLQWGICSQLGRRCWSSKAGIVPQPWWGGDDSDEQSKWARWQKLSTPVTSFCLALWDGLYTLQSWKHREYSSIYRWRGSSVGHSAVSITLPQGTQTKKSTSGHKAPPGWVIFSLCGQTQAWDGITRTSQSNACSKSRKKARGGDGKLGDKGFGVKRNPNQNWKCAHRGTHSRQTDTPWSRD